MEQAYTTIKGAAKRLDVHTDTIRRLIHANQLPFVRIGRAIRIPLEALTPDALADMGKLARGLHIMPNIEGVKATSAYSLNGGEVA